MDGWLEWFEERCAILEFDGGMSQGEAQAQMAHTAYYLMKKTGERPADLLGSRHAHFFLGLMYMGKDLYIDWFSHLRDSKAKVAVIRRVARIEQGNSATTSSVVMACGSCASTLGHATESITPSQGSCSCCCSAVATSARRAQTSTARWTTGRTGNGDRTNEKQNP